jgi:hypothetical protein
MFSSMSENRESREDSRTGLDGFRHDQYERQDGIAVYSSHQADAWSKLS